jgi:hypothetical protein
MRKTHWNTAGPQRQLHAQSFANTDITAKTATTATTVHGFDDDSGRLRQRLTC